ncbi:MAG TPA: YidC/Oxa1 family membrane protein insertase [Longimicrobiales bacterium]
MHRAFGLSYGWVLILFGILIRLAMWPLNAKAMRSQLKSMELQPRLKDIQTRYKNDPQKLQQEMMRLYKEEGFNPMGGCLPMLIPMPVLITLFFVFQSTIEFRGVSFLWLPDLSQPDQLYILPIALGLTIFAQQLISMKTMPPNPQMKFMMYFMPLFMVTIFFNLASGLNLYYAAQNLPGFIQQMQLTKERVRYQKERGLLPTPAPAPAPAPATQPRKSASRRKR